MATGKVAAVVLVQDGDVRRSNLEAVSEAARLASEMGGEAIAVAIGKGAQEAGAALGAQGVARVIAIDGDEVALYNGDIYGQSVAGALRGEEPQLVLVSATAAGKDLGPRVAAHLDCAFAGDCTGLSVDGAQVVIRRPVYAGKATLELVATTACAVATLRPNNFEVADGGAEASVAAGGVVADGVRSKVLERRSGAGGARADLTEAERIVAGGRGMKGPEHFALLESLAELLGATVGASRAVVDAGWRTHGDQVGQTGKTVSPKLYIAVGISGAIQHLAGMQTSGCIVAINKDADAPIFRIADYGIVGDLFEVLPAFEEQLKGVLV